MVLHDVENTDSYAKTITGREATAKLDIPVLFPSTINVLGQQDLTYEDIWNLPEGTSAELRFFNGKKVFYLGICRHRHIPGLWAMGIGKTEKGYHRRFLEYDKALRYLVPLWNAGESLADMKKKKLDVKLFDVRDMTLIMSHPDWEFSLKPIESLPEDGPWRP